jgi:predicted nucleotidyltransferase
MCVNIERQQKLQSELDRFLPILIDQFKALKIIVFGSLAGNEVAEWSDIDLVVVRVTRLRFLDRSAELIQALQPRVGVDFLVYTPDEWDCLQRENLFVRKEIFEKGKELYAA